jgi:hypothetical protein
LAIVLLQKTINDFNEAFLAGNHQNSFPVLLRVRGISIGAILQKYIDALLDGLPLARVTALHA